MSVLTVIGIAIIGVIISILLKKYLPEYSMIVVLITGIIILFWITVNMAVILDKLNFFLEDTKIPNEYVTIVFKSLGLAFIVQLISDICKDVGEGAIASKVELVGKISILIISLPLFEKIMSIIFELIK